MSQDAKTVYDVTGAELASGKDAIGVESLPVPIQASGAVSILVSPDSSEVRLTFRSIQANWSAVEKVPGATCSVEC